MSINNEREYRINKFLKLMAEQSKKGKINSRDVYNEITNFEIQKNNKKEVSNLFNSWIQRYKNVTNTSAFIDERNSYFCYIMTPSIEEGEVPIEEPIKLYLSLKEEYLVEGVNQIIDFLSKEDIVHQSKVASKIRTDNIVMRIYKKEDAEKVIHFINKNEYIKEGHQKVNPFCITAGIVGMAMDNYNSYNFIVSWIISEYINEKKEQNKLKEIEYEDFLKYVEKFKINSKTIIEDYDETRKVSKEDIVFLNEIKKIFKVSLKSNNRKNIYNHYYKVYKNLHLNGNKSLSEQDTIKIIESSVLITEEKYDHARAIDAMSLFLISGNKQGITKETTNGEPCRMILNLIDHKKAKRIVEKYDGKKKIIKELQNYLVPSKQEKNIKKK